MKATTHFNKASNKHEVWRDNTLIAEYDQREPAEWRCKQENEIRIDII